MTGTKNTKQFRSDSYSIFAAPCMISQAGLQSECHASHESTPYDSKSSFNSQGFYRKHLFLSPSIARTIVTLIREEEGVDAPVVEQLIAAPSHSWFGPSFPVSPDCSSDPPLALPKISWSDQRNTQKLTDAMKARFPEQETVVSCSDSSKSVAIAMHRFSCFPDMKEVRSVFPRLGFARLLQDSPVFFSISALFGCFLIKLFKGLQNWNTGICLVAFCFVSTEYMKKTWLPSGSPPAGKLIVCAQHGLCLLFNCHSTQRTSWSLPLAWEGEAVAAVVADFLPTFAATLRLEVEAQVKVERFLWGTAGSPPSHGHLWQLGAEHAENSLAKIGSWINFCVMEGSTSASPPPY